MSDVRRSYALVVLGLLATAGCSAPSDQPELAEVTGTVTLDGVPMPGLLVLFGPEKGRTSHAWTDEDGRFEMMYLPDTPGAVIGPHTVSISSGHEEEEEPDPQAEPFFEPIPAKYNVQSTLTREVLPGSNEFMFDLSSEP